MAPIKYLTVEKEYQEGGVFYKVFHRGLLREDGTYDLRELFDVLGRDGWNFVRETYSEVLFKREETSQAWNEDEDEEEDESEIELVCSECGAELTITGGEPGDIFECPECGQLLSIDLDEDEVSLVAEEKQEFEIENGVLTRYIGDGSDAEIPDDVTEIDDDAFAYCSDLRTITIPVGLRKIGKYAFANCENLTKVIIPDTITSIGEGAFADCEALEKVKLPKGITEIKASTFDGCKSLQGIVIPDGVEEIDNMAFYECRKMTYAVIPDSVEAIAITAFSGCKRLSVYAAEGSEGAIYAKGESVPLFAIEDFAEERSAAQTAGEDTFESDCCVLLEILEKLKNNNQLDRIQAIIRPYVLSEVPPTDEDDYENANDEEWYDGDEEDDEEAVPVCSMIDDERRKRLMPVDLDD